MSEIISVSYNQQDIKLINRSTVLKLLCIHGTLSRMQLSALTGMSRPAITNIVNEMLQRGIVSECDLVDNTEMRGRRPIGIKILPGQLVTIGVNISRGKIKGVLLDLNGTICEILVEPLVSETEDTLKIKLFSIIDQLLAHFSSYGKQCIGIGISVLGPVDLSTGTLLNPTNFYGISYVPLKKLLETRYSYPIVVDHDINAATIAEKFFGNAKSSDNFVYMGVGQGVSCGMYVNGNLCKGMRGFCGEIGHCSVNPYGEQCSCGNNGCLELYVSTGKILERVHRDIAAGENSMLKKHPAITWEIFIQAVSERDPYAYSVLRESMKNLSNAIVTLINVLDPELIIIGDSLALGGEIVIDLLKGMIAGKPFCSANADIPIQLSQLHDCSPVIGAACIVLNSLFNSEISVLD
jgi:predicted NBD/HSP70 family sugar kinase